MISPEDPQRPQPGGGRIHAWRAAAAQAGTDGWLGTLYRDDLIEDSGVAGLPLDQG
jgi:hypothetical protein